MQVRRLLLLGHFDPILAALNIAPKPVIIRVKNVLFKPQPKETHMKRISVRHGIGSAIVISIILVTTGEVVSTIRCSNVVEASREVLHQLKRGDCTADPNALALVF